LISHRALNSRIGVGVIGASPGKGWASSTHIPALRALPDYELVAVSTSRRDSAEQARQRFKVPFAFDQYAELITHPAVDLVVVSVRVPRHFELVGAAIEAGKMVFSEWPLGNGLDEALSLARMARAKGVGNWVGLQLRAAPTVNRARDLIREGYVGEVLSSSVVGSGLFWGGQIDADHAFIFDKRNGITPLTISFAHRADAVCFCLGEFEALIATLVNRRKTATIIESNTTIEKTAEDQIAVSGTLVGGAVASFHYRGGSSRGVNLLWEVNGTEGDLQVIDPAGHGQMPDQKLLGGRGSDSSLRELAIASEYFSINPDVAPGLAFNVAQQYVRLASDIRHGTSLCATFDDAVIRHRMLSAIEKSASTGQRQSYATTAEC
jgi:predicted dehydrogenase